MRVALDVNISRKDEERIRKAGHTIVAKAMDAEADEDWMERARHKRADCVVSNDLQVQSTARQWGMIAIENIDIDEIL